MRDSALGSKRSCVSKHAGTRSPQRGHLCGCPLGGAPRRWNLGGRYCSIWEGGRGGRCGPGEGDSLSACRSSAGDRPHQDTEPKPVPEPAGVVIALRDRHPGDPQTSSPRRPPTHLSPPLIPRPFRQVRPPSPLSFQISQDFSSLPPRCSPAVPLGSHNCGP